MPLDSLIELLTAFPFAGTKAAAKKNKKGNVKKISHSIDHSYLSCSHHLAMVEGLALGPKEGKVLVVGLGGGPLVTYIHNNLKKVRERIILVCSFTMSCYLT